MNTHRAIDFAVETIKQLATRTQGMVRCFVAVECNTPQIIEKYTETRRRLEGTGADIKFVEPENLHLTLKFLGEVEPHQVQEVSEIVESTTFAPFSLTVEEVGVFPSLKRPRVVWAGIIEGVTELADVAQKTDRRLSGVGFERERRKFQPHLTLGRVRTGRNREALVDEIQAIKYERFGTVPVEKIVLKKSVLTPSGPVYTNLAESKTDR